MIRRSLSAVVAAGVLVVAPCSVFAQQAPAAKQAPVPARMDLKQLAPDVYALENSLGSSNAGFVVTPEGVLVWDADISSAHLVLAAIRKTTDKKIRYVAISHPAGDHATGVWAYREDKPVMIATRGQMRDLYMQEQVEFDERKASNDPARAAYKGAELVKPDIAFDGALTLNFGGLTFQFTEEGSAHSTSDVTLYIPQKRVMMMGDLLNTDVHPGQGESAMVFFSNPKRWIEVLDRIIARRLPIDTFLPGHGQIRIGRGAADLEEQKRYWIVMRDEMSKLIAAGRSIEQIQAEIKVPAEFAHYRRPARLRQVLVPMYHQLLERGYNP